MKHRMSPSARIIAPTSRGQSFSQPARYVRARRHGAAACTTVNEGAYRETRTRTVVSAGGSKTFAPAASCRYRRASPRMSAAESFTVSTALQRSTQRNILVPVVPPPRESRRCISARLPPGGTLKGTCSFHQRRFICDNPLGTDSSKDNRE